MSETRPVAVDPARLDGRAFGSLTGIGAGVGVVGLGAALVLGGRSPQFYFSWLVAYLYFLSIALGGLFFVLVLAISRAGWGITIRRILENLMATLPIFAALFVPIWIGRHELYEWTHPDVVAANPALVGKAPFLNEGFFFIRAVVYFVIWSSLATYFSTQSQRQDESGDERVSARLRFLSAPGIMLFALTLTFATIDWMMSLQPEWYSTMIGVYYFAGSCVAILCVVVLATLFAHSRGALRDVVTVEHLHDVGKLMFGFVIFWTYIAFSQYFLIWYANLPEETIFYMRRSVGSWQSVGMVLAFGHFLLPFFFLMPRAVKRSPGLLATAAIWLLIMHFVDLHWNVMPVLHRDGLHFGLIDVATLLAVGGFFVAAFGWVSSRRALVPLRDPRLPESLSFENV